MVSMLYKRNQLEDAISSLVEPTARQPSAGLRTRTKRLFETDRAFGRSSRASDSALLQYAFFSEDPPGRGVEIQFSPYEAFALLIAIHLVAHGWALNVVVAIMRQARKELENHHARILKSPSYCKADFESRTPLLVVITSSDIDGAEEAFACSVREGYRKAMQWTWELQGPGHGVSMFELASHAQNLANALARSEPRHRGQQS